MHEHSLIYPYTIIGLLYTCVSRYIVCKYMKNNKDTVQKYMQAINVDLCRYMSAVSKQDILHIVPLKMMLDDEPFFTYMVNSNEQ